MPRPRLPGNPSTLSLALAATVAAGVALAEPGTVLKATELRSEPQASAEVVAKLAARQGVEITGRQGAWAGIRTDAGQEGWTRILNLRTGGGQAGTGGGNPLAYATGSRGSSVATAVKGLSADELMSASPNHAELALLDEYAAAPDDAAAFAAEVPLAAQDVAYVKDERRSRRNR